MMGLNALAHRIFGSPSDRKLKKLHSTVAAINALEPEPRALDDEGAVRPHGQFREHACKWRQ